MRERRKRRRDSPRFAGEIAGRDTQRIAGLDVQRPSAFERAGPDFRAAEILKDRDLAFRARGRGADAAKCRRLRLVSAVRKIEAEDVGAGGDQGVEHRVGIAGGADRRDDLGVSHVQSLSLWGKSSRTPSNDTSPGLNQLADSVLLEIARAGEEQDLPLVDAEVGALLRVLATAVGATRILEIGTAIGYSGIWLAGALPANGMLVTMEMDQKRAEQARENFVRARLADRVNVMVGDASRMLAKVSGPFDLIFQDGDKQQYLPLLDRLVELLRPGGLLVTDNVLWDGEVVPGFIAQAKRNAEDTRHRGIQRASESSSGVDDRHRADPRRPRDFGETVRRQD